MSFIDKVSCISMQDTQQWFTADPGLTSSSYLISEHSDKKELLNLPGYQAQYPMNCLLLCRWRPQGINIANRYVMGWLAT